MTLSKESLPTRGVRHVHFALQLLGNAVHGVQHRYLEGGIPVLSESN